jgi:hypothetical protein
MRVWLWLVLSLCISAITWLYMTRVLGPWVHYSELGIGIKTQMGDLYSPWVGTRELILNHRNPYGPEVSHEIQMAFYGHDVNQAPAKATVLLNEQRFAYPIHVVFLLAPVVHADFAILRWCAWVTLALLTAGTVLLSLSLLQQRPPWQISTALILLTLSSPQLLQGLQFQQLALVVGFLLVAGAWCVSKHYLATAGVVFAFSTIKPQMALLPLCAFAIWVVGDWTKRWRLAASFVVTLTALLGAGELLLPGWFEYFLRGILAYRRYAPTSSQLRMILGDTLGEIIGGAIVFGLLLFVWRNRSETADSRNFANIFAAVLAVTILAFPLSPRFNQVLLIFPVTLLLQDWKTLPRLPRIVFAALVSWPWIASATLLFVRLQLDSPNQLPLLPTFMTLFFPLFVPLLLMTRRTSATVPQLGAGLRLT